MKSNCIERNAFRKIVFSIEKTNKDDGQAENEEFPSRLLTQNELFDSPSVPVHRTHVQKYKLRK